MNLMSTHEMEIDLVVDGTKLGSVTVDIPLEVGETFFDEDGQMQVNVRPVLTAESLSAALVNALQGEGGDE